MHLPYLLLFFFVCVVHYMCLSCSIDLVSICANKKYILPIIIVPECFLLSKRRLVYMEVSFASLLCFIIL